MSTEENSEERNVLVVNITQTWDRILKEKGRTPTTNELYDITRGRWVVGKEHLGNILYICAAYQGIIQTVYRPVHWYDAKFSQNTTLGPVEPQDDGRYEFICENVPQEVSIRYCGATVAINQNPVQYIEKR